jgi:hypothetical protein
VPYSKKLPFWVKEAGERTTNPLACVWYLLLLLLLLVAANFQWASGGGSAVQYLASSGAGDTNDWWVYVTFDTTYAGALPTITGPTTVYKDPATNKPYAWVYIPKGTSFMAFQAASSLGSYMWYYKPGGLTSKCSASTGLLSTAKYGTNDHCYQLNCPSSDFTYCEFRTSTTFYSPYSVRFDVVRRCISIEEITRKTRVKGPWPT